MVKSYRWLILGGMFEKAPASPSKVRMVKSYRWLHNRGEGLKKPPLPHQK